MADIAKRSDVQVIDSENGEQVAIPSSLDPTRDVSPVWMSKPPVTTAEKAAVLSALTGTLPKLSDKINEVLNVRDVILQGVMLKGDAEGELKPAVRTILITEDGSMFAATSEGIRSCIGMIFQLFGKPPWKPSLPLRMKQQDVGDRRRWFTLEYVGKVK